MTPEAPAVIEPTGAIAHAARPEVTTELTVATSQRAKPARNTSTPRTRNGIELLIRCAQPMLGRSLAWRGSMP